MFILPVGVSSSTGKTRSFDATFIKKKTNNNLCFVFVFVFVNLIDRSIKKMSKTQKALLPSSLQQKKMCVKKKKVTYVLKKSHTHNIFNQTNPPAYLLT